MRTNLLLTFLTCLLAPFAAFSINIGGVIASNTTLTLVNSPYIVTSNLTVNAGVTLTVPAGVELRFNSGIAFTVYGTLAATSAIFTSNDAVPVNGSWANVTFGNGSTVSTSTITGCTFNYAAYLYVNANYTLNLTGSTVTRFSGAPLSLTTSATANINNSTLSTSNVSIAINGGTANFSNNSLINNMGAANSGITLTGGSLTLANTNITNCSNPLSINSASVLNISGTTSLLVNAHPTIKINFGSLSSGTFNLPTTNVPYVFLQGFTVASGATLSVADSNIIKFQNGTGLAVDGILVANASVGKAIYFTSYKDDNWGGDSNEDAGASAPAQSNWTGIKFNNTSNDAICALRRVKIRYAVNGVETNNASPTVDLCDFSINYYGFSMLNSSNPVVTTNTFGSSTVTPIAMSFESNPTFTNNSFSFSDNQYDAIGLYGGTLTASGTVKIRSVTSIPNVTYVMLGSTIVPAGFTLTIEAGVVIKTRPGYNTNFQVSGTIIANGSLANPIVFTSVRDDNYGNPFDTNKDGSVTSPAVGDFGSISMLPGSTGSIFNYCKIRYAGGHNDYISYEFSGASFNFINASGTVQNSEIKDVKDGINCFYGATPTIQDNQFTNLAFAVTLSAAANPTLTGNILTNVSNKALGLVGVGFSSTELSVSGTIRQKNFAGYTNITYVLRNHLIVATGANVNIEAGVVIKNLYYGFTVNGGFKTDGTLANPVIFSSIKDDNVGNPGDTNGDGNGTAATSGEGPGIYFSPSSDDSYCKLSYLKSYYGGGSYSKPYANTTTGVIGIESANPVIDQVLLSNLSASVEGIGIYGNGSPSISNVNFQNGTFFPISMSLLSNPSFSNITFTSMGYSAILINDNNINANATLVTRSVAGISNIAYVINKNLTVNSGATLTISAGVVIKFFIYGYYQIIVNGALVVNGTVGNKVIFTAVADDSAGGDSNNNGNATAPTVSWYGIKFEDPSDDTVNKIEFAEIRFAGASSDECIVFKNSGGNINNVSILFGNTGLGVYGTANPVFQNVSLQNLQAPVRMDMFANPTFGTITANNIAVMGILIPTATYSQTGTFPVRNFAGYANVTYILDGLQTINGGTTITIPAGMVFKGNNNNLYYQQHRFSVLGRLNISGTSANPVVITSIQDDQYGNPADTETNGSATLPTIGTSAYGHSSSLNFGDIADDNSNINYAIFRYAQSGIYCLSSSPTITNCTFSMNTNGVYLSGTAAPTVNTNSFVDLVNTPILTSILTYPSSTLNNIISGTTWKGIGVLNETLSQDINLPKRNFGGYTNIPYVFTGFTVGTTATLTIAPGVVTKWQGGTLNVNKGLNAIGGLRADSNIIFTSYRDDFYGGDMNSDSTATTPFFYDWSGIVFNDVSLDPLCKLSNCFIRYTYTGITATNASPDIKKTSFGNLYDAISASGSSNPLINFCDFYNVTNFGVNNVNQSFIINAENNWWGKNTGPTHATNFGGTGSKVSNAVDYLPYRTTGPNVPIAGDVSQNGLVQAYDASQILQFLVSTISLTPTQQSVGDVSGNNSLSALDASYILQYSVGLINGFPSEAYYRPVDVTRATVSIGHQSGAQGATVIVPVNLSQVNNLFGSFARITFDSTYLELDTLRFENTGMNGAFNSPVAGTLLISMAGTSPLNGDATIAYLHLKIKKDAPTGLTIPLVFAKYQGNEKDLTALAKSGSIKVLAIPAIVTNALQNNIRVSPVPAIKDLTVTIENSKLSNPFIIMVTDVAGKKLMQQSIPNLNNDGKAVIIKLHTSQLPSGLYILSIQSGNKVFSEKIIIAR